MRAPSLNLLAVLAHICSGPDVGGAAAAPHGSNGTTTANTTTRSTSTGTATTLTTATTVTATTVTTSATVTTSTGTTATNTTTTTTTTTPTQFQILERRHGALVEDAARLIMQMQLNETTVVSDTPDYTLVFGKTMNLSGAYPAFDFPQPFRAPQDSADDAVYSFVYVSYKGNIFNWSDSAPPHSEEPRLARLEVTGGDAGDLGAGTAGRLGRTEFHLFADAALPRLGLCMCWEQAGAGEDEGRWSTAGITRDDAGCRTAHLGQFCAVFDVLPSRCGTEDCEPARCGPALCHSAITLDGAASSSRYDGHGAVSAGASSRLLHDYPEPHRGHILDYLFLPSFGAALHLLKVEIGGDSQSGYGTEPSHMHGRHDLSCTRGHGFWLLREGRRRNPGLVVYALSWATPHWVGVQSGHQGVHDSQDSIDYHVQWLQCAQRAGVGRIDYLGARSGRSRGPATNWTIALRAELDAAGFNDTAIIAVDGVNDPDIVAAVEVDSDLAEAMAGGGVGLHYPCYAPHPAIRRASLKLWSSEDHGVAGDWAGAACWGRSMNQNFVQNGMTSTVARSLAWGVYPGLAPPGAANGLVDAFEPWSGHYRVRSPVWVTAHTTQFTDVGWRMLDAHTGSAGFLTRGGSYVTYVSPDLRQFTLVVEKLHGDCARCSAQVTLAEPLIFRLAGGLELWPSNLSFWMSNATHEFVELPSLAVGAGAGSFSFVAEPDSIYTVSTTSGQAHGEHVHIEQANTSFDGHHMTPFPLPHADDFDTYAADEQAKYFADYAGSWQVATDPTDVDNKVLKQWVERQAGTNQWAPDSDPITLIGASLRDLTVSVQVLLPGNTSSPKVCTASPSHLCEASPRRHTVQSFRNRLCLAVSQKAAWSGAAIEQRACANGWNEQLAFDTDTGLFAIGGSGKCVTMRECPPSAASDVCQMDCGRPGSLRRSRQTWLWGEDESIRPRAAASLCLTATGLEPLAPLRLAPCASPGPSVRQRWVLPANSLALYAGVCARLPQPPVTTSGGARGWRGYCLSIGVDVAGRGWWRLLRDTATVLAQGSLASPLDTWHNLSMELRGPEITALIDGRPAGVVGNTGHASGMAALTSSWGEAYFDGFQLAP